MGAHLAQLALVHHQNLVGLLNGGEAMGDQHTCPALDHALQCAAYAQLGVGVHARGSFVEDENAGIECQCAGKIYELLLAGRKRVAALLHRLVELAGKALDEVQNVDVARSLAQIGLGDSLVAEANVLGQRAGEEKRILQHDGEVLAQRGQIVLADVDAVDENLAGGHVVEAHHQAGESGFSRSGVADDGD